MYTDIEKKRAFERKDYWQHAEERREAKRRWRRTAVGQAKYRDWSYRKKYGISLEDYNELYKYQNGLCAVCQQPPEPDKPLHVDHDHTTGVVRGLLCSNCNKALGLLKDDSTTVRNALDYLERSR
jgi:hypothetical protein